MSLLLTSNNPVIDNEADTSLGFEVLAQEINNRTRTSFEELTNNIEAKLSEKVDSAVMAQVQQLQSSGVMDELSSNPAIAVHKTRDSAIKESVAEALLAENINPHTDKGRELEWQLGAYQWNRAVIGNVTVPLNRRGPEIDKELEEGSSPESQLSADPEDLVTQPQSALEIVKGAVDQGAQPDVSAQPTEIVLTDTETEIPGLNTQNDIFAAIRNQPGVVQTASVQPEILPSHEPEATPDVSLTSTEPEQNFHTAQDPEPAPYQEQSFDQMIEARMEALMAQHTTEAEQVQDLT